MYRIKLTQQILPCRQKYMQSVALMRLLCFTLIYVKLDERRK
jgi:hypothetical protein